MDSIGALRQGNDLGFKTSTFPKPNDLRTFVLPLYRDMVELAHRQDKPFILHSCDSLGEVYGDLIDYCRIDAKHSFKEVILPAEAFKQHYGERITPLGGLDVDAICRRSEQEIRAPTREGVATSAHLLLHGSQHSAGALAYRSNRPLPSRNQGLPNSTII